MDSSVTILLKRGKKRKPRKYTLTKKKFRHEHMFPSAQDVSITTYNCSVIAVTHGIYVPRSSVHPISFFLLQYHHHLYVYVRWISRVYACMHVYVQGWIGSRDETMNK